MFDVSKLTLEEVGAEIDKTLDKLSRLQALYSAMQEQDHRRIERLVKEYNQAKLEEGRNELVMIGTLPKDRWPKTDIWGTDAQNTSTVVKIQTNGEVFVKKLSDPVAAQRFIMNHYGGDFIPLDLGQTKEEAQKVDQ